MSTDQGFRTQIFADGADLESIRRLAEDPRIAGFTTNPTLMRQAGITDYEAFARDVLDEIDDRPISFEVFADEPEEILRQAHLISSWASNVFVKIPVTTTLGDSLHEVIAELSNSGVQVNVTAVFTPKQTETVTAALLNGPPSYISVFAGRIADAGIDPIPIVSESISIMSAAPLAKCIWASPREVLNLVQAEAVGCHVITMTSGLLAKLDGIGKDLTQFSLETVRMFFEDATSAGYKL